MDDISDASVDARRADELIAAALRGEDIDWHESLSTLPHETFLARCRFHRVEALLLHRYPASAAFPAAVRNGLQEWTISWVAREAHEKRALGSLVASMTARGLQPLFLKGVLLAYTLYDAPEHRWRCDADILVHPDGCATAHDALVENGFEKSLADTGTGVVNEAVYLGRDRSGVEHNIDLHWKMNVSELLANLFTFEELLERSVAVPRLCPEARGLGPVDALLHACMHRQIRPAVADRLIWIYDIHLLANALTAVDWDGLVRLARAKGLASACLEGLSLARERLGTSCPERVLDGLRARRRELPADYLRAGRLRREWMDFRARRGAAAKLRYIAFTCLPSPEFMRDRYPDAAGAALPWLYLHRAAGGIGRRLRRARGQW